MKSPFQFIIQKLLALGPRLPLEDPSELHLKVPSLGQFLSQGYLNLANLYNFLLISIIMPEY